MSYKVKITEYKRGGKVEIQYPPSPTSYIYRLYEEGVKEMLVEKLLTILKDENAEIQVVEEESIK